MKLAFAALSDVGRIRKDNQDSGYAGPWLIAICDGVGGAARGDIASATAIGQIKRLDIQPAADASEDDLMSLVANALHRAHDRIGELVEVDPNLNGTSTTATVGLFDGTRLAIGHVGDSRAYLLRGGLLHQLSKDHTFVQTLVDEGRITEDEARVHPHKNLILNALDGVRDLTPDLSVMDLEVGDRILFCSDGVNGFLTDPRIADILGTSTPAYATVELLRASLEAGSTDNVTCLVADVVEDDATVPTMPMTVGAAAEMRRKPSLTSKFRGHRMGDTGELEPIDGDIPEGAVDSDPAEREKARYALLAPSRQIWTRRVLALLLIIGLFWSAVAGAYSWTQTRYFVKGGGDGYVTIYRGINANVLGFTLYDAYERTTLKVTDLNSTGQAVVDKGVDKGSLTSAETWVRGLSGDSRVGQ